MRITKAFKSGNSVAVRFPKSFGIQEGTELTLREEQGRYVVEPVAAPKRKFNIDKVWGCAAGLRMQYIKDEDRVFEHRALLWDDPDWLAKYGKRD